MEGGEGDILQYAQFQFYKMKRVIKMDGEVPFVAQRVRKPTDIHEDLGSVPGPE